MLDTNSEVINVRSMRDILSKKSIQMVKTSMHNYNVFI